MLEFALLKSIVRFLVGFYETVAGLLSGPPRPKLVVRESNRLPAELANVGSGAVVGGMAAWTTPEGVRSAGELSPLQPKAADSSLSELCDIWWRDRHIALVYQDVSDRWYWSSYCRKRGWRTGQGGPKEVTFDCGCQDARLNELKQHLAKDEESR